MNQASGTFEVKLTPQSSDEGEGSTLGRLSLDKQYQGDLEATGKGEMLSVRTKVTGSAGYVAIERVTGTLHGKTGSFVLQHDGLMNRGAPALLIHIVPDSGSGELTGISGSATIKIEGGKHFYAIEYTLPDARESPAVLPTSP